MAETLQIPTKVRYDWIDVLKFFGIWAVYISHTGDGAVVLHPVVHTFCVELFFFISGFFACKKSDTGFRDFVFRRFCQLIIPYAFFLVLYFIPMSLDTQMYHPNFPKCLLQGILGMRDRIFAASLWFFPCLFVLSVLYSALYRFASRRLGNHANRFLIAVSILLYIAGTLTQPIVLQENAGDLWGVNAACRYMIFFASGHILFPFFREFRFAALKPGAKVFFLLTAAAALSITLMGVTGSEHYHWFYPQTSVFFWHQVIATLNAIVLIYGFILISVALGKIRFLADLGRATLILCGTEQLVVLLLTSLLSVIGVSVTLTTPLMVLLWTFLCLCVSYFGIAPVLRNYFPRLSGVTPPPSYQEFREKVRAFTARIRD